MPYYIGAGDPEWDQHQKINEERGDYSEPPISLFKYVEPWTAGTTVLQFPETPGPRPQDKTADPDPNLNESEQWRVNYQNEQKHASELGLWAVSGMTAKCRANGIKRVFGDYDGGGDESFTYFRGIEMNDERRISADSIRGETRGIDCEQLIADGVAALMGGSFDAGEFILHGAVVIDFEACTVTDERNVDVVFGE